MKIVLRATATVIAIAAIFFIYSNRTPAASGSVEPVGNVAVVSDANESGDSKINFSWKDADGNVSSFDELRGKVVLVNFWATWCVPCRKEIPYLIDINNELDSDQFIVIGISVDNSSDINKVDIFINDQEINYINILDDGRLTRQFGGVRAIPTTFILDKDGSIKETIVGIRTKEQFMEKIKQYL